MNQKLKGFNNCKTCGQRYEMGFYGAGPKYCSHKCNKKGRNEYDRLRNRARYVKKNGDCKVCGRNILKVGLRKQAHKYCSKKCLNLAQRMREGRKFCTIKIPVKDLPVFFGQIS